jgi:hypothetical protein
MDAFSVYINHWLIDSNKERQRTELLNIWTILNNLLRSSQVCFDLHENLHFPWFINTICGSLHSALLFTTNNDTKAKYYGLLIKPFECESDACIGTYINRLVLKEWIELYEAHRDITQTHIQLDDYKRIRPYI